MKTNKILFGFLFVFLFALGGLTPLVGNEIEMKNAITYAQEGEESEETPKTDPQQVVLEDEESGVILEATTGVVSAGATMIAQKVDEDDSRFSRVRSLLSTPKKLVILEISLQDAEGQPLQIEGEVTLKIKLDETFDEDKVKVFRVDVETNDKVEYDFILENGYVVLQTDHFSLYTFSQSTGFKPVSPSKDGTSKMAVTLIVMGASAVVAAIAVAVAVIVNKKKR